LRDKYALDRLIGVGGMAAIYEAPPGALVVPSVGD
jgi:hypothetical protein